MKRKIRKEIEIQKKNYGGKTFAFFTVKLFITNSKYKLKNFPLSYY